jgi:hypothetical protein
MKSAGCLSHTHFHPNTPRDRCDPGNVRNAGDPERFGRGGRYGAVLALAYPRGGVVGETG